MRHSHHGNTISLRTVYWLFILSLLISVACASLLLETARQYDKLAGILAIAGQALLFVLMLRRDVRRLFRAPRR